ncbi:MAG: hypothetical protein O2995_12720 [Proteobacteria bacterium]|nr:hypothetical protein [Pseudomonadota bacterium]
MTRAAASIELAATPRVAAWNGWMEAHHHWQETSAPVMAFPAA